MSDAAKKEILKMRHIDKNFPGVRALSDVDFTLREGEIHALMGENGAGKSTLIKVPSNYQPFSSGGTGKWYQYCVSGGQPVSKLNSSREFVHRS